MSQIFKRDESPAGIAVPESDPKYGTVLEELFVLDPATGGLERVAVVEKSGRRYLVFQDMYVKGNEDTYRFGKNRWIPWGRVQKAIEAAAMCKAAVEKAD